jgi:ABC-2 type transport system ATP-binding protein
MNTVFENQINEVYKYIEANDTELALRRLTDCAFETKNTAIFKSTLNYYEWLEENPNADTTTKNEKAYTLLATIKNAGLQEQHNQTQKILTVANVGKTYKKSGFKINNLNFTLNERQITGLVGENGNGKTTLLRLLAAELNPDVGNIDYHFVNTKEGNYNLKTKLIYIEQRIPRWHGTLLDNLYFVLPYYGLKGQENQLWADLMIARLGLRPYRHLTWKRISSGYRTRFELAKTLLRSPKILLLDEPLANLDIISQQTILQDLKYMANSISSPFGMILSSQHIYEVEKVSDTIIFIKNGVPQYQNTAPASQEQTERQPTGLLLEVEVNCTRDQLIAAFGNIALQKIQFNGGVYLLHFDENTTVSKVLDAMAANAIEPGYFRNISQSSRRFFIN